MENKNKINWLVSPGFNYEGEHLGFWTKLFDSEEKANEYSKELVSKGIGDYVKTLPMKVE